MALPKGLLIRSNGYYFQAHIPKKYHSHYPSSTIYCKLPADTRKDAERHVHEKWAELHQEFKHIDSTGTKLKKIPIGQEADHLIATAIYSRLNADEEIRTDGVDDFMYEQLVSWTAEADESERLAISIGKLTPHTVNIASDWLLGSGYDIDIASDNFKHFAIKFMKAQSQATKSIKLRDSGEVVDTPPVPLKVEYQVKSQNTLDTLEELRDYWLLQPTKASGGKKSRTSIAEANTIIKKFKQYVGDLKPNEVKVEHIVHLKDKMLEAGSSPATINKGRGIFAAIFSTATKNAKLASNPFGDMEKLSIPRGEVEKPYTVQELQTIFNSTIYIKGERPKRFQGESAYWLPLLALYSGARLNELDQLFTEDVGIEDGINYFMIKPDTATGCIFWSIVNTDSART